MKQRSKLLCGLLCLALCLCMVLIALPATKAFAACEHVDANKKDGRCDTCGSLMQDVYFAYTTASLEGNISVNYFMLLSDAVANDANAYIQFTMADDEVIQIPATESKLIDGYDVFTCQVNAKEMTDIITMQFYYKGQPALAEAHPYNVRAYAKHIMDKYQDAKTLDLMEKMVNYGAAAQIHFGYNANDLANNFLANKPDYSNVTITGFDGIRGQGTQKVKLYSASLLLTSETTLRLFFNGKVSVTLDGKPLKVSTRSGLYYVDIVGIAAKELDDDVTVVINDGTETASITYNPMTYCQAIQNSAPGTYTDKMQNLVRALYLYNQSADDYFASHVTQGTNMVNALHYLNGDTTKTKITSQIKTVTFGYSRDYRNIANKYPATLISAEQETPVYAYYVKTGSTYDVYVLANDTIYAPTNSTGLFQGMTNVTSIGTENLDVSRVDQAVFMFRQCDKLTVLDTTGWDTSNITNMQGMFYKCTALTQIIGIKDWDVSNVTSLYAAFYNLNAMTELDLSGWDVGKVTNLKMAICRNKNLQYLDISGWNVVSPCDASNMLDGNSKLVKINATGMKTSGITNAFCMFMNDTALTTIVGTESWTFPNLVNASEMFEVCQSLQRIDVTNWGLGNCELTSFMFSICSSLTEIKGSGNLDLSNVKDASMMFQACSSLSSLDVTNWDLGNCTSMNRMFTSCESLVTVDGSENWNTGKVTDMYAAFDNNARLVDLDVSTWNTGKVTNMSHMFSECFALAELDVSDWNVSNVKDFSYMFKGEGNKNKMALSYLDLSDWDTRSAENMECMFQGCGKFTEFDVSNWDMRKVTNISHMFADCYALTSIDLSKWETPAMVYMDAIFNHCSSLTYLDMSNFDTSNVLEFSQMFDACSALEQIDGLTNWDTAKGATYSEMFSGCNALKELDLSSFDTRGANQDYYYHYNLEIPDDGECYQSMFNDLFSLEKLVLGENFSFDGDGKVTNESYKAVMPTPSKVERWNGHWYDETGKAYKPSAIPEKTAHTYVAYYTPQGTTMKNALTYLNADPASTGITTKVTSITFGLTKDHAEIANTYPGVLADQEQDAPVYAYYVPNGSNYDVYFLSENKIFLPASSKSLFSKMSVLQSVTSKNLDTSRVTTMYELFFNCPKLKTVDLSHWDVSQVTNMCAMFENCTALTAVNASNWNTGNVKNMSYMFHNCPSVTTLDVSGWDTAKVTTMQAMFAQCSKVTTLDVSGWDTSNVTNVKTMFKDCSALKSVVGSGQLNLNKATDLYCMFENCGALEYLDVTNWGLENVTAMTNTFFKCYKLTTLEGCENWNLSNVTSMVQTFCYCHALTDLDVSTWDTSNCTNMSSLFKGCRSLTTLAVDDWDVSNVKTFASMFSGDGSNAADMNLTHLNLSKWNMSSAQDINRMFYGCAQLTALDLSGWDVRQLQDMNHMFADCHKLATINFTGWQTDSLTNMDAVFNHCKALKSIDLSMFNTAKVTKMCQMFEACSSLEEIIGLENFDTSLVDDFSEMFTSTKLTTLDLSSFNTASAQVIYSMFNGNQLLETIYVGDGWDMSQATSYSNLFDNCVSLVGGNGTTYAGSGLEYACVDTQETPGYLTYKAAEDTNS